MKVVNESYVGFVATNAIFIREGTDYSRQRPAGAKQLHLHSRDGFALEVRDLGNRVVMSIEEIEKGASGGRKKLQGPVEEFDLAARVQIAFEIGRSGNQAFIDGLDVLGRTSPTPVIPNGVIHNFHEKRARMGYLPNAAKCFPCMQRHFLLQVLIVDGSPGSFRGNVDHGANLRRIDIHVTVLRRQRLYLT